ncbi:MAG TPA: glycosyltransferase [Phycisphaerae bacterium]|nr:glycosyltransferase [Phycisphaerae bacterium]
MPTISVVIPTFNGGSLFAEVLAGLRRQRVESPVELLIIDSGSTDDTLAAARQAGARVVQIPQSEFDHGLTRNWGIELTTGEIVVLLTQDAVPADEYLMANLIKPFEDPRVAGAFARQIPRAEHDVLVKRNIQNWIAGGPKGRVVQIENRETYERMSPIERYLFCVFDNVCSAVRREAWREVAFRQNAFGEDIEWSKRALEAGWKIAYEPTAAVVHSHSRSARYEYKRTYMGHRTLYRLFGLATVPERKYVWRSLVAGVMQDAKYVMQHEQQWGKRLSLLARLPALSWSSVMGQYRGARDERLGRGKRQKGI